MGWGLQLVLALAISTPQFVRPDVVGSEDSECEKLLPPQRVGNACHVTSSQLASQLQESELLPSDMNIPAPVKHELAAHLIRHPEIRMVTCDPRSPGRDHQIDMFPYLRISLPVTVKKVRTTTSDATTSSRNTTMDIASHAGCPHRPTYSPPTH